MDHRLATAAAGALLLCTVPVQAQEPASAPADAMAMPDHVVVLARTVHPRIAYRGPAPDENPERVVVTVFPGRTMGAALGAMGAELLGDGDLADNAPMRAMDGLVGAGGPVMGLGPMLSGGPQGVGGANTPVGRAAGSVGGSVMKVTGGLGSTISRAVLGATGAGGGP